MSRAVAAVIAALALGGLGAAVAWRMWLRDEGDALVIAGTVESRDVQVGSLVGGRVATVPVDEGDLIERGAPVVTLDNDLLRAAALEQEARVAAARAEADRIEAGPRVEVVERARIEWQNAEAERRRLEALVRERALAQARYDEAAARAAALGQAYEELRHGSRPEDIAQARARVAEEQARLRYLREQLGELVIRAPARSIVQSLPVRPGDLIGPNQAVASLRELDQLWVRAYVPETRLGLIAVGQAAEVTVDTYPDRPFSGRVARVSPEAEYTPRNVQTVKDREDQVFAIRVEVPPTPLLKPGMSALVRLAPAREAVRHQPELAR